MLSNLRTNITKRSCVVETIVTEIRNGVGVIRFHRPEVRNAVNLTMMSELYTQLEQWQYDDSVRVLILTGSGSNTFVSGGDVEQLHQFKSKETITPLLKKMGSVLDLIQHWGKPTIAMINGYAVGGGCEIATACDFRFANVDTKIGFIQINIGITTGWGGGTRLLKLLGRSKALSMLLTGNRIDTSLAHRLGFIDELYPLHDLEDQTMRFAERIASRNLNVTKGYIEMANRMEAVNKDNELINAEIEQCAQLWESDDHLHAVEKFLKDTRKS